LIEIKPIEQFQIPEAKRVILKVVQGIYHPDKTVDELLLSDEHTDWLQDLDDVHAHYFTRRGTFLAAFDEGRLIGTGAVRPIDDELCELKRMWLLEEYHGQGIGYRLIQLLLAFARVTGYKKIRLETGIQQERAIRFYKRVGFQIIPLPENADDDVMMEMLL
jgi:putative acetyltransferase